jgi:hypothetical protein
VSLNVHKKNKPPASLPGCGQLLQKGGVKQDSKDAVKASCDTNSLKQADWFVEKRQRTGAL